jgi:hypothetical protein
MLRDIWRERRYGMHVFVAQRETTSFASKAFVYKAFRPCKEIRPRNR